MSNKDSPHEYLVSVRSNTPIPHDVLIEHIAVALRDFKLAGKIDVQMAHPFDNPNNVLFDDEPQLEEYTGMHREGSFSSGGEVPETIDARTLYDGRSVLRTEGAAVELLREMGVTDPYPFVTRALDALKSKRRG